MFFLLSTSISTLKQLVCDRLLNQAFEGGGRERTTPKNPNQTHFFLKIFYWMGSMSEIKLNAVLRCKNISKIKKQN